MTRARPTVLIVDDEPDVCWALARVLSACGVPVIATPSGQEALELAERTPVFLALVDAKLPDAQGLEMARRLRQAAPGVRTVLISGYFYRDDAEIAAALAAGEIDGFVSKPFQHDEIRAIVRAASPRPVAP